MTQVVDEHPFQIVGTWNHERDYNLSLTHKIDSTTICHKIPNSDSTHTSYFEFSFSDSTLHFYTNT